MIDIPVLLLSAAAIGDNARIQSLRHESSIPGWRQASVPHHPVAANLRLLSQGVPSSPSVCILFLLLFKRYVFSYNIQLALFGLEGALCDIGDVG